jgi:CRP-like cAMP-binding protein
MECPSSGWRDTHWARTLEPGQLERVAAALDEVDFPGGTVVCRRGDPVDAWVGVLDGLVKISNVSAEGKAVTLAGVPSGGWFGEGSLLKQTVRQYDVVALRDSRIAFMPRATFLWLLDTSIGFNRFLLTQLNERLGQFIATVEFDRLLDPEGRIARCLAQLFNPHLYPGTDRRLQISQEEIGYLSGVSRQRVNQALQALERAGLLRVEYGGVTVLDLVGLAHHPGGQAAEARGA